MLALNDPNEAYRRSEIDARIRGSRAEDLVTFCLEQAITGIGHAILAHSQGNATFRSKALTRALTAVTALEMGIDRQSPLAEALLQLYGAARQSLLDCVIRFDTGRLETIRADFIEIRDAFSQAAAPTA